MLKLERFPSLRGMDSYRIYRNGEVVVDCNCSSNCTNQEIKNYWFPWALSEGWENDQGIKIGEVAIVDCPKGRAARY